MFSNRDLERQHNKNQFMMINDFSIFQEPCSKIRGINSYFQEKVSSFESLTFSQSLLGEV